MRIFLYRTSGLNCEIDLIKVGGGGVFIIFLNRLKRKIDSLLGFTNWQREKYLKRFFIIQIFFQNSNSMCEVKINQELFSLPITSLPPHKLIFADMFGQNNLDHASTLDCFDRNRIDEHL